MDTAFKRLWARRKSNKNNTLKQESSSSNDGSVSMPRPSFSTNADGRPSLALSSYLLDPIVIEDRQGLGFVSTSLEDYNRPKSGHRIQPVLVGISRPNNDSQRPVTAGTASSAVPRPSVDGRMKSSDISQTSNNGNNNSSKPKSPRYIDIFAVAHTLPMQSSQYNEEIAERNAEIVRDPAEQSPHRYMPTSKVQEKVVNRNLLSSGKNSVELSRGSADYDQSQSSAASSKNRDVANQNTIAHYTHQYSTSHANSNIQDSQESSTTYIARQNDPRTRDGASQLEMIPKETTGEDTPQVTHYVQPSMSGVPRSPTKPTVRSTLNSSLNMDTITERPGLEDRSSADRENYDQGFVSEYQENQSGVANVMPRIYTPDDFSNNGGEKQYPAYADFHLQPVPKHASARPKGNNIILERNRHLANSPKPSSISSSGSHKPRNLTPHRNIMDLTGDDDAISDGSSIYGYSQYSPVIEQAKVGSVARAAKSTSFIKIASEDTTADRKNSDNTSNRRASDISSISDLPSGNRNSMEVTQTEPIGGLPMRSPARIAFSRINTMASLPPGPEFTPPQDEPRGVMVQKVVAALEARDAGALPQPTRSQHNDTETLLQVKPQGFRSNEQSENSGSQEPTPRASQLDQMRSSYFKTTPETSAPVTPAPSKSPTSRSDASRSDSKSNIFDSPQSLNSVDYVHPSSSFGVLTRDFAVTPRKSTASLKKSDPQGLQKSATENAARAASQNAIRPPPPATPSKTTTKPVKKTSKSRPSSRKTSLPAFDEAAFAQKQAEARAALVKLQQSLAEDFLTLPEPAKWKNTTDSITEESAPAPTISISPIPRTVPTAFRLDSEKPPSSFKGPSFEYSSRPLSTRSNGSRSGTRITRKTAPPSLQNVEVGSKPVAQGTLTSELLLAIQTSTKPPLSPGEISLSSFPIPASRPQSGSEQGTVTTNNVVVGPGIMGHMRRDSVRSRMSTTSQYSIPNHMIPDRSSSFRDLMVSD